MDDTLQSLVARMKDLGPRDLMSVELVSVTWAGRDLLLKTIFNSYGRCSAEATSDSWLLRCKDVRNAKFVAGYTSGFTVKNEHPLLLPHTSPVLELYFRGVCADAHRAVGQLLEAHQDVVGEWFRFRRFLNACAWPVAKFLEGGFGRLATGPQALIERYADGLRRNGLAVSSPPLDQPTWEKQGKYYTEGGPMWVLFLGHCFVVAPEITAELV